LRDVPGLRAAYDRAGLTEILARNPWEINAREVLDSFVACLTLPEQIKEVVASIEEKGYQDVCLDLIRFRHKPRTNGEDAIDAITAKVCKVLRVSPDDVKDVASTYDRVFTDITRV